MGQARKAIAKLGEPAGTFFTIGVPGHALLVDHKGKTVVDTDPRKADRRKVNHCSIVEGHGEKLAKQAEWNRRRDLDRGFSPKFAGLTMGEIKPEDFDEFVAELRIVEAGGKVLTWGRG